MPIGFLCFTTTLPNAFALQNHCPINCCHSFRLPMEIPDYAGKCQDSFVCYVLCFCMDYYLLCHNVFHLLLYFVLYLLVLVEIYNVIRILVLTNMLTSKLHGLTTDVRNKVFWGVIVIHWHVSNNVNSSLIWRERERESDNNY